MPPNNKSSDEMGMDNSQTGFLLEIEAAQRVTYTGDPPAEDHATPVIRIARMLAGGNGIRRMLIDPEFHKVSDPCIQPETFDTWAPERWQHRETTMKRISKAMAAPTN